MSKPNNVVNVVNLKRTDIVLKTLYDSQGRPYIVRDPRPVSWNVRVQEQFISGQTSTPRDGRGRYRTITDYSATYIRTSPGASCTYQRGFGGNYSATWRPNPFGGCSPMSAILVEKKAAVGLADKLKQGSPNLAVGLAEHKQTASLLLTNAARVVTAIRSLKRFDLKGVHTALRIRPPKENTLREAARWSHESNHNRAKIVADYWLEVQYGWKPFLSDVYQSYERLFVNRERPDLLEYSATASDRSFSESRIYGQRLHTRSNMISCRVKCNLRATPQDLAILEASSFGITNPLLVAWELVPFSFVVDWFIPIGNYLDAYGVLSLQTIQNGVTSTKDQCYVSSGGIYSEPLLGAGAYVVIENSSSNAVYFNRKRGIPSIGLPRFKNPFSDLHVANALSLLISKAKLH